MNSQAKALQCATVYYKAVTGKRSFTVKLQCPCKKAASCPGHILSPNRITINILYRKYDPGYISFHGKGPLSSSAGDDVSGFLVNFTFEAAKYLFISAGCDLRYFPWMKYRCSAPSTGLSSMNSQDQISDLRQHNN